MKLYEYKYTYDHENFLSKDPLMLTPGWNYNLNVVKNIRGTEGFLALPDSVKDCQLEPYDNCTTRSYVDRVIQNCNCLPLKMRINENEKVINYKS